MTPGAFAFSHVSPTSRRGVRSPPAPPGRRPTAGVAAAHDRQRAGRVESLLRTMTPRLARALLCLSAILAACALPPAGVPTAIPASASPQAGSAGAGPATTPPLHAGFLDVSLIAGRYPGDWSVIGLVANSSTDAVSGLEIDVSLFDASDQLLAHQVVRPALETIGPGAQSPFAAHFAEAGAAAHPRAEVIAYHIAAQPPARIEIDQLVTRAADDGRTAVYGRVTNETPERVEIEDLAVLASWSSGAALALSDSVHGLSVLDPGEAAPFTATLDTDDPALRLRVFGSARSIPDEGQLPLSFPVGPRVEVDSEGAPLVLGMVRNDSGDWWTADIIVSLRSGDELLGICEVVLPWPVAPGESLPFLADEFPDLRRRMRGEPIDPERLSVEAQLDPAGSRTTSSPPTTLQASVTTQEVVGGSLFLRGTLSNTASERVERPTVLAVLRSTDGETLSAGFVVAGPVLDPAATLPFVLTLHLPQAADLSMAEFDLRAGGFRPE